jgi:hypothetical protein
MIARGCAQDPQQPILDRLMIQVLDYVQQTDGVSNTGDGADHLVGQNFLRLNRH